MIPAPPRLAARYRTEGTDNLGTPYKYWDHKAIVAFDDEGIPLIIGERKNGDNRRLIRADTYTNYDGMTEDPDPRIVSMIPAVGWRVAYKNEDGSEWTRPLVGWGVKSDGDIAALDVDSTGLVEAIGETGNDSYRIYHEDEPSD